MKAKVVCSIVATSIIAIPIVLYVRQQRTFLLLLYAMFVSCVILLAQKFCRKPPKRNVKEKVKTISKAAYARFCFRCLNNVAGCFYYSPCSVTCLKGLTLETAIERHSEFLSKGGPEIIEKLAEDKFLKVLLGK